MLELKDVSYSYKNIKALKNINITIEDGEAVAFIGPNGSGKSTLMKLINGILVADSGQYIFNEEKITSSKLQNNTFSKNFHKKIGFVFQNSETQLFCSNVYDEIAFGPRQMGLKEEEVKIRVTDCMELLKIEKLQDRAPYHLSGGEKKKVAIASVLVLNPEVIVFDEPMNDLDPKTKRFLKELLINLNNAGKTIICSTHEFEYVSGIFNRVIVFSNEHIIIRDDEYEKVLSDRDFLFENNII
ncbi:MAG: ABC transporter ATP-binding protein [Clostridiaceae bacterium]|nr:ABC transporter ATP-binding protein [Clostridiaceae bacterium]